MEEENWSDDEINYLVKNYLTTDRELLAVRLNRSIDSVRYKAKTIGLINKTTKKWSDYEVDFLKKNYSNIGKKKACDILNRSMSSVGAKVQELGLLYKQKPVIEKEELQKAVQQSYCMSNLFDNLNKTCTGSSVRIIKKYLTEYQIDTSHFDPYKKQKERIRRGEVNKKNPIEHWLQYGSTIGSSMLKHKLYKEGLKQRCCEKCGQGEEWRGDKISLILDHINGDAKDNRLENLRILCPNCNAALPTHCRGYKKIKEQEARVIKLQELKAVKNLEIEEHHGLTKKKIEDCKAQRRVERPPLEQLQLEIEELGYLGTGRKYGVSDNAIRKWVKTYTERGF
jgi:hypothetical protein